MTISLFISLPHIGQLKCLSDLGGTETLVPFLPKLDDRYTCDPGHYRLTKSFVHLGATERLVALMPKGVCINLHYSGRVPEAEIRYYIATLLSHIIANL